MKLTTCLFFVVVFCCCGTVAFAAPYLGSIRPMSPDEVQQIKQDLANGVPDYQGLVGGEDIPNAANIPGLPYSDGGNTCGFLDNYDEVCPYTGSTSPDVVYKYTPGADEEVDISLCNSLYDTKLYVYENSAGTLVACNDDACGDPTFPYQSALFCVPMTAGNTYYIVVDGWGGDCGEYSLSMNLGLNCQGVECPPGAMLEGEVTCFDGYDDQYNGGCNSSPEVYTEIPCSPALTVCGTYGVFDAAFSRDTDWYHIPASSNTGGIVWCVTGVVPSAAAVLDLSAPGACAAPPIIEFQTAPGNVPMCFNLPAGELWLFVSTDGWDASWACGSEYVMTLDGQDCPPVTVEETTWGQIKERYTGTE